MDLHGATDRYHHDPAFKAMVDSMRYAIRTLLLSPSEVREAAMFAVYAEEISNPRPMCFHAPGKEP